MTADHNAGTNIIEQMESELMKEKITNVNMWKKTMGNTMGFYIMNQLQDVLKEAQQLKDQQKQSDKELKALQQ